MFIDARQLDDGSAIACDVAIIGAGAFGITLARALRGSGRDVVLIESGGLDFEDETQALYEGATDGIAYNLDTARLRYFGGSTNHWGGWCRPIEPEDFEARAWVPHSGWPVSRADLDPYYPRAQEICELGAFDYSVENLARLGPPLGLPGGKIADGFFQFSPPTRFGERYRDDIANAADIRCLLNANVTEIVAAHDAGSIARLDVATLTGKRFTVTAGTYVLAAGGIENARLLLASRSVAPAGLANDRDLVGRYFMEHPIFGPIASWICDAPERIAPYYGSYTALGDAVARGCLSMTPEYMAREGRLNTIFTFTPNDDVRYLPGRPAEDGPIPLETEMLTLLAGVEPGVEHTGKRVYMGCGTEQAPNPDSRVTLADEVDALGMPRTRLAWQITEGDRESLLANVATLAAAMGAWGHARLRRIVPADFAWNDIDMFWAHHHMGTTRMAAQASQGVVDANLKVHGLGNLFIGGSSVWTTGCGATNPTLSIVAFALRLAERLRAGEA
ncbi:MAG: GMC family oxidoreductase [Proteobacteria bacterium]|nr:GMC family oxidoreductase [Pseudomonadota bacterium]